ncbi:class I SAM-dependent methyltransferase [Chroococcidiopsis sp.]|uniref:class I SAM-dependent methyltransferase n=1 Tax=Chroococcidiopsis sp. TaxID=3088168 RepID=UPI003F35A4D0
MLKKLPISLRFWLRSLEHKFAGFFTTLYKYKPYKKGVSSYVIPKSSLTDRQADSVELAVPPQEFWLGYGKTREEYLSSGAEDTQKMLELAKSSGLTLTAGDRVLDFGCGACRMTRHLQKYAQSCEIWGVDIDADMIYWCKEHLEPLFNFAVTTTIPHLPFEDRYFDLIYAGSLFTHVDDLTEAWLLELRRILSPKGRLYLTIHDNQTIKLLHTDFQNIFLSKKLRASDLYNQTKNDMAVLTIGRDTGSQVFYDIDYFCKKLSKLYKIHSVTTEAYNYQTAVLVGRK